MFPIICFMGELSLLRPFTAELLTSTIDLSAKIIYSAMLYWTNFLSFERFELLRAISSQTDFSDLEEVCTWISLSVDFLF